MWRLGLVSCLVTVAAFGSAADARCQIRAPGSGMRLPIEPVAEMRIARLEHWLGSVDSHNPGYEDRALLDVAEWTADDLRSLWIDVDVLAQLMRKPKSGAASVRPEGQRLSSTVNYSSEQRKRLVLLACAAAGILDTDVQCYGATRNGGIDEPLSRLAAHAASARRSGERHYVLRRGALLHTDLAILDRDVVATPSTPTVLRSIAPQAFTMDVSDGRQVDFRQSGVHWEIARMLLDNVAPREEQKPEPGLDPMVRDWYRATAAWMQLRGSHDTHHLDHARELLRNDPDILFLSGTQHETLADATIQAAMRSAVVPNGVSFNMGSERDELRQADGFFKRALEIKPDAVETRLRQGRVQGELGRHAEAASSLEQATHAATSSPMAYYADLFLGAEREALGRFDLARTSYESAAALYPRAQSPLIALSQLARRTGDRAGALRSMEQLFALPRVRDEHDDPWWMYYLYQARGADALIDAVRKPFLLKEAQ
ncbi:MAG TPA: tetratricopeptide repeat protein [Vicinamibacterales bacterium]